MLEEIRKRSLFKYQVCVCVCVGGGGGGGGGAVNAKFMLIDWLIWA